MATAIDISLDPEHLDAIKALAHEVHRPEEEVARLYTENFERLSKDARIKDYLVVLTCKKVHQELRK